MAVHATDDSATFLETDAISGNLLSNDSSDTCSCAPSTARA